MNSQSIHDQLDHPVIDSDAHWLEFGPMLKERIAKIAGREVAECFTGLREVIGAPQRMGPAERRRRRIAHSGFWQLPMANALDRATAMMPKLLHERMDELGLDFCVMYPTGAAASTSDPALRRKATRAFNTFCADYFADYADRMTPVAVIPTNTPEEAIEELEHAVVELGLKAALFSAMIPRKAPAEEDGGADDASRLGRWYDVLGLDSAHDYDPLWQKCVDLGVNPTFHAAGRGYALRRSPSNFTYNHIGHFASTAEAICKAMFLGGVTRRFPTLKMAFLEGGVSYACQLYADLIEHWEIRNRDALEVVNPANLDHQAVIDLARQYGPKDMVQLMPDRTAVLYAAMEPETALATGGEENLDDFAACQIASVQDFRKLFANFYFGCEADDRMNVWAFNDRVNPLQTKINALFSSDIGHFDVPDMRTVLEEAHGLVAEGLMSEADFRTFTFTNPAHFWTNNNPNFFTDTVVERPVRQLLTEDALTDYDAAMEVREGRRRWRRK